MQPALVAIWLSVLLGAALGVWQRFAPRVTDPIRTFAVVAAALVITLSLLPHALECEGVAGLLGAAAGYLAIPALERLGMALFRRMDPQALRLELGYGGLLLHRFGDGVTMSVEGHGHAVLWALGAHEVPIVALVTLAFVPRGVGVALARAAGLGLSSSIGYFMVSALPATSWDALHGWADAAAAGVLLHIVVHEGLRIQAQAQSLEVVPSPARSLPQRVLDLAAALLACGLIAALSLDHDSGALQLLHRLLRLALQSSPWLCLGLLLRTALRRQRREPALQLAIRTLDPVAVGSSLALLGMWLTAIHALLLLLLTLVLLLFSQLRSRVAEAAAGATPAEPPAPPAFAVALERELVPLAGWVLLGFLVAAYVQAYLPAELVAGSWSARLAWTAVLLAGSLGSAAAAVPLAATLVELGLPAPAALAGLSLGACAPLLLGTRARLVPAPAVRALLFTLLAGAAALTALAGGWLMPSASLRPIVTASGVSWLSLAALLVMLGRYIWQTGVTASLVTSLGASLWPQGSHGHEHPSPGHG